MLTNKASVMLFMKGNKQVRNSKMVLFVISFDVNICSKGTVKCFFLV